MEGTHHRSFPQLTMPWDAGSDCKRYWGRHILSMMVYRKLLSTTMAHCSVNMWLPLPQMPVCILSMRRKRPPFTGILSVPLASSLTKTAVVVPAMSSKYGVGKSTKQQGTEVTQQSVGPKWGRTLADRVHTVAGVKLFEGDLLTVGELLEAERLVGTVEAATQFNTPIGNFAWGRGE